MLLLRYSDVRVRLREQVALEVWFVTVRNFRNFRNDNGSYFIDEYLNHQFQLLDDKGEI